MAGRLKDSVLLGKRGYHVGVDIVTEIKDTLKITREPSIAAFVRVASVEHLRRTYKKYPFKRGHRDLVAQINKAIKDSSDPQIQMNHRYYTVSSFLRDALIERLQKIQKKQVLPSG